MKTLLKLDLFQWFFVIAITVSFLLMQNQFVWLKEFPKEFIFPVSRTQMYRQLGNSVAIPVVKKIAKEITKYLN